MEQDQRPSVGMDVIDSAENLVGTVESVEHDHFVVQKGFFFPQNHRLPISAIESITEGEVFLRISRDEALSSDADVNWAAKPRHGESVPDDSEKLRSGIRRGADPRNLGT